MNRQTRILGISGSLRRDSYNSAALRAPAGARSLIIWRKSSKSSPT
jgi:hypothetical protein